MFFLYILNPCRIFVKQSNNTTTMKTTADSKTTKLVKKYLKKCDLITIPCQFQYFGDITVRFVSVGETEKWNHEYNKYGRVLNFEITMKKSSGVKFCQDNIPSGWRTEFRNRFFRNRKYFAQQEINQMLKKTNIPLFLKLACVPIEKWGNDFCGNITYKYID